MPSDGLSLIRKWGTYGLFFLFAGWCVLAFKHDIVQIDLSTLAHAQAALLAVAGLSLLNYALRVVRWRIYLKQLGYRFTWRFTALSFMAGFAFTLSPGKLGEIVRSRYYLPKGLSVGALTGAFFVERLMDLLAMIVLASVVLTELQHYRFFFWVAVALVVGLLAVLALIPWGRVRLSFGQGLIHMLAQAQRFLTPKMLTYGLLIGLVAWLAEALGLKLLADLQEAAPIAVTSAIGIYALSIIVGALSFLPGGLGSTEAVMSALLVTHGMSAPQAILTTLVCRLLTLWFAVAIGWLCVWQLRRHAN
ncbi:MAG: flippase-like domain-containing protein [Burkholderiales bacterium]|nr:flippase-like domain-containing protein [Burkholderiales bacterium]